jgi:hypothetical protein
MALALIHQAHAYRDIFRCRMCLRIRAQLFSRAKEMSCVRIHIMTEAERDDQDKLDDNVKVMRSNLVLVVYYHRPL